MKLSKDFLVFRKSTNTNAFGLYQVFLMAKDGETYNSCASKYNVKPVGVIIPGVFIIDDDTGLRKSDCQFTGHELTVRLNPNAPDDVIKDVWKLKNSYMESKPLNERIQEFKGTHFYLLSPDGFTLFPKGAYTDAFKAQKDYQEWKKRYEGQGYYSSNNYGKIPLDKLECFITVSPKPFKL